MVSPGCSNTTAYNGVFDEANSNPSYFSSENIEAMKPLPMCGAGYKRRKRNRKTRKASRKKRRKTKRAGSGMFDTVYDSIFGKQEKPPPKPKTSSDEFVNVDVDPSSAPWLAGPADGGYKGQGIGVPMEDAIDPSDYDSKDLRILGLRGDPTEKQIKDAYRKKARKCHPDKVPGKLKEFQKLQGANERVMEKYRMKHPTASKKKRPKKTTKKRKKPKKKTSKKKR